MEAMVGRDAKNIAGGNINISREERKRDKVKRLILPYHAVRHNISIILSATSVLLLIHNQMMLHKKTRELPAAQRIYFNELVAEQNVDIIASIDGLLDRQRHMQNEYLVTYFGQRGTT